MRWNVHSLHFSALLLLVTASNGRTIYADRAELLESPYFKPVKVFADAMLEHGRDRYGPVHTPLFVGQLNIETHAIPACTELDPGLLLNHPEVGGAQPYCQNLLFEFGLLDVLQLMSKLTGERRYTEACREHLRYLLTHCRHPESGYIPWGEHVGYDVLKDEIHIGEVKGEHEVKGHWIAWDMLWEADPDATRHEIEIAFYNHLCDRETFAFNRHAPMSEESNLGRGERCSLAGSAGVYLDAWVWLYRKTGERQFLDWANRLNAYFQKRRDQTTGLFGTDENRRDEMWYADAPLYACFLLHAAEQLGEEGNDFRTQALDYFHAYARYAITENRDFPLIPFFYDSLNIRTGQPVPGRPPYLEIFTITPNSNHLGTVLLTSALGYVLSDDAEVLDLAHQALQAMQLEHQVRTETDILSGDAAGVIFALVSLYHHTGERDYLECARVVVDYILETNYRNSFFLSGAQEGRIYYSARHGAANLASAVLTFALADCEMDYLMPSVRDVTAGMRY